MWYVCILSVCLYRRCSILRVFGGFQLARLIDVCHFNEFDFRFSPGAVEQMFGLKTIWCLSPQYIWRNRATGWGSCGMGNWHRWLCCRKWRTSQYIRRVSSKFQSICLFCVCLYDHKSHWISKLDSDFARMHASIVILICKRVTGQKRCFACQLKTRQVMWSVLHKWLTSWIVNDSRRTMKR